MVSEPEEETEEDEDSPPLMGQTKQSEWASGSADSDIETIVGIERAPPHMPPTFPAGLVEDHGDEVRLQLPAASTCQPASPFLLLMK